MKKYLTISNFVTIAIIAAVLYLQAPTWLANTNVSNTDISNIRVRDIESNYEINLDNSQKYILFFWATWCAPCKAEMQRYKSSIESGKIKKENFIAVNPFETPDIQAKFIKKNPYPFTFVDDGKKLSNLLEIRATPTVTFVEKGIVTRQSTGISIIGIFRAEWLFQ